MLCIVVLFVSNCVVRCGVVCFKLCCVLWCCLFQIVLCVMVLYLFHGRKNINRKSFVAGNVIMRSKQVERKFFPACMLARLLPGRRDAGELGLVTF